MKNIRISILLIFILLFSFYIGACQSKNAESIQRYNDSLLIYKVYQNQIQKLKTLKDTEFNTWYLEESFSDSLTVCAIVRLSKYNKKHYDPVEEFSREGIGFALSYPKPTLINDNKNLMFRYAFIDYQTHFMVDSLGRTRIPFIRKYYYDQFQLLFIDTLDPVTFKKL